jgi:hypothetical protein
MGRADGRPALISASILPPPVGRRTIASALAPALRLRDGRSPPRPAGFVGHNRIKDLPGA